MIYITGDMHGAVERLYDKQWLKLKRGDILLICGDFGYLWNGAEQEREYIDYLSSRKFTVAFIDGTHDNMDIINSCRTTYWKGGMIHRIKGNLIHLMRGQVFNIDGYSFFAFGGGESIDKDMRIENGLWWKEEMPTPNEMSDAAETLDNLGRKVDFILTHEPPLRVKSAMSLRAGSSFGANKLNGYFEEIDGMCEYSHWFFGSMHEDRKVTPKHSCLFKKIVPITNYIETQEKVTE